MTTDNLFLLVGSANGPLPYIAQPSGAGISAYAFDAASGTPELLSTCGEVLNPTFVAAAPGGDVIAAVTERGDAAWGTLTTLRIDRRTGEMHTIGAASSMGVGPAHLSFDGSGQFLAGANYSGAPVHLPTGASVTVFALGADGSFARLAGSAAHAGSGPDAGRQERSHAHCARWSPDGRYLFVVDLGTDEVVTYRVDGGVTAVARFTAPGGSGPRHLAFHLDGRWAYLVAELSSQVISLIYADGSFRQIGIDTTLPPGGVPGSTCSAVHVTPDGRFVLAGNRGHDSIATLAIGADGIARHVRTTPSGGRVPRDFAIDPSGRWVAVANQESNNVSLFRLEAGELTPASVVPTGSPTSVCFVPRG